MQSRRLRASSKCGDINMKNLLKSANKYELFDIYEMLMEDYYHRQYKLINKQIENYINKTYVDIKDLSDGDKNLFYLSNAATQSNDALD